MPQLLAPLSVQFGAQNIVAKLANWNVRLSGTATGMQRSLRCKTVKRCSDQLWHASNIRAAGANPSPGISQSTCCQN
jgi:hypothetical protein